MENSEFEEISESVRIVCKTCSKPNTLTNIRCELCGHNLSGIIDIIDRRTHNIDEQNYERRLKSRRLHERIAVDIFPVKYKLINSTNIKEDEKECVATILNLSKVGIFIKTDSPYSLKSLVYIIFFLPNDSEEISCNGEVVRIVESVSNLNPLGMAILFKEMNEKHKKKINYFVDSVLSKAE